MRFWPAADRYYASKIKTLNVYWDVSLSGRNRNLDKELEFLGKYIERNQVQTTRIFLFNHQLQGLFTLDSNRATFEQVRHYLRNYSYAGATQFGQLDFKNSTADAILFVLGWCTVVRQAFQQYRVGSRLCCQFGVPLWLLRRRESVCRSIGRPGHRPRAQYSRQGGDRNGYR